MLRTRKRLKVPVRLKDVAQAAGVSVGTASRVLNSAPEVTPDLAQAVRRAIDRLGYIPPPANKRPGRLVRTERHATTGRVAVLLSGPPDLKWILDNVPVFAHVIHGVEAELAERGMVMVVRRHDEGREFPELLHEDLQLRGLIMLGWQNPESLPASLAKLPQVWALGLHVRFEADHLTPSGVITGELAANYLLRRGHRCCAALGPEIDTDSRYTLIGGDRFAAFVDTIQKAGGSTLPLIHPNVTPRPDVTPEQRHAYIEEQAGRFAAAKPRPTGLFLWATEMAPSVYRCLRERGIEPGRDIDIVTCNHEQPFLRGLHPQPAVIDIREDYIGKRAVERLLWRIRNPDAPIEKVIIAPRLIEP